MTRIRRIITALATLAGALLASTAAAALAAAAVAILVDRAWTARKAHATTA